MAPVLPKDSPKKQRAIARVNSNKRTSLPMTTKPPIKKTTNPMMSLPSSSRDSLPTNSSIPIAAKPNEKKTNPLPTAVKKAIKSLQRRSLPAHSGVPIPEKMKKMTNPGKSLPNTSTSDDSLPTNSSIPIAAKPNEKKTNPLPTAVKKAIKSLQRRSLPAHSGVPIPEKMKKMTNPGKSLPNTSTSDDSLPTNSSIPIAAKPNEKKTNPLPTAVKKAIKSLQRRSLPAHSGVPIPEKMKKMTNPGKSLPNTSTSDGSLQSTSSIPIAAKPNGNKSDLMPISVKKKSWQRRPLPAHSGVPLPEKLKKLLEKGGMDFLFLLPNIGQQLLPRLNKSVPLPKEKIKKIEDKPQDDDDDDEDD